MANRTASPLPHAQGDPEGDLSCHPVLVAGRDIIHLPALLLRPQRIMGPSACSVATVSRLMTGVVEVERFEVVKSPCNVGVSGLSHSKCKPQTSEL